MKFKLTLISLTFIVGATAFAGTSKFDSDAFNDIISDSLNAEKDLREQLRANSGVPDLKNELNPNFAEKGKQLAGTIEAEDVAAPSSDYSKKIKDTTGKKLYEKSLKRVSQEIKDLETAE